MDVATTCTKTIVLIRVMVAVVEYVMAVVLAPGKMQGQALEYATDPEQAGVYAGMADGIP